MSTLGLDPSTKSTGWGLINSSGDLVAYGAITPPNSCKTVQAKIACIYNGVKALIELYHPTDVSCENQFMGKKVETVKTLSQLRGVIMLACEQCGLVVNYYWPASLKLESTGTGKATKDLVVSSICQRYGITDISDDTADAIAAAITHQNRKIAGSRGADSKKKKK